MAKLNIKNGVTSVVLRVKIMDSTSTTGGAKTGLTSGSSGLIVSTIADNEASATAYTGGNLETIATLGTFAAPTSGKARFKEVDATNHPGLYEIQIADARWAVSSARSVIVTVSGVTGAAQVDAEVQLEPVPANVLQFGSADGTFASGRPAVNTSHLAGSVINTATAQLGVNVVSYASGQAPLQPTTAGRTLDVTATGEAGIDWGNIGAPSTTVSLSGTTVKTATDVATDTASILTKLPSALVSGRMDASVGSYQTGLTPLQPTTAGRTLDVSVTGEAGLDFDNIKDATGAHTLTNITVPVVTTAGAVSGNVAGNVVGTVASVVGNVGGSVASVTAAVTLPSIPSNWITAAGIAASALNGKGDWLLSSGYTAPLSASGVRTALGLATNNLDTQLAGILAEVDSAAASVLAVLGTPAGADLATDIAAIYSKVDTEVAAIKAKTDLIPAAPAAVGDVPTANDVADAILLRSVTNTEGTATLYTLSGLILAAFKSSMSGTTWTIKKTGGTTFSTRTLTEDAAAVPVVGVG